MTTVREPRGFGTVAVALLALAVTLLVPGSVGAAALTPTSPSGPIEPATTSVAVNITATSDLSFVPDSFTVLPGETVHLIVTQAADFPHTFTLASLVNFSIPSSDTPSELAAFFNAHPPLVNLSLGSTPGSLHPFNFTAPSVPGTYEFVCLIHFPTMTGVMTDSASAPSGSGSSGPPILEIIAVGAGVGAVVIVAVVVVVRRGHRPH